MCGKYKNSQTDLIHKLKLHPLFSAIKLQKWDHIFIMQIKVRSTSSSQDTSETSEDVNTEQHHGKKNKTLTASYFSSKLVKHIQSKFNSI